MLKQELSPGILTSLAETQMQNSSGPRGAVARHFKALKAGRNEIYRPQVASLL